MCVHLTSPSRRASQSCCLPAANRSAPAIYVSASTTGWTSCVCLSRMFFRFYRCGTVRKRALSWHSCFLFTFLICITVGVCQRCWTFRCLSCLGHSHRSISSWLTTAHRSTSCGHSRSRSCIVSACVYCRGCQAARNCQGVKCSWMSLADYYLRALSLLLPCSSQRVSTIACDSGAISDPLCTTSCSG